MKIVITGGAGFLGSMLTTALLERMDHGGPPLGASGIVSMDLRPSPVDDPRVESVVGDLSDPAVLDRALDGQTAGIYHLAAVLSGGSEQDFDHAMAVNVDATRCLLERLRCLGDAGARAVRLVFTSSLAVFGGSMPQVVPEHWATQPNSTYGAFKAVGELLVNEYSRKGFLDGRICRLPTIAVRPGRPNSAASSFASGMLREPLNGIPSTCPVPRETRLWLSSPRSAVANLVHALELPAEDLGSWRALNMPGLCVSAQEMLDALEKVAGAEARALVEDVPDSQVMDIVCSWPGAFDVDRMVDLGFVRDETFEDVIRQYVEDHLS